MTFEEFNDKWCEAFGARLTERNGAGTWADFVEDERCSDGLIVKVLNEYADEYAELCKVMSPHARKAIPTCKAFRKRYFEYIDAARAARGVPVSACKTCGGYGHVVGLAPCKDDPDRKRSPEDYRTVPLERVYPFPEAYDCPTCRADSYRGRDELRARLLSNALPEIVPADHPRNNTGAETNAYSLIRDELWKRGETLRQQQRQTAAEMPPPGWESDDELEREFPMEAAQ